MGCRLSIDRRDYRRSRPWESVGYCPGGWALGWGFSGHFYTLFFSISIPASPGGHVLGRFASRLLVFYIRRNVQEPEVFRAKKSSEGFLRIFHPDILRITSLTAVVAVGAQGDTTPSHMAAQYLKGTRGLSVLNTGGYLAVIVVGSFVGT